MSCTVGVRWEEQASVDVHGDVLPLIFRSWLEPFEKALGIVHARPAAPVIVKPKDDSLSMAEHSYQNYFVCPENKKQVGGLLRTNSG